MKSKREVIAALLQQKRPDLANALAGTEASVQGSRDRLTINSTSRVGLSTPNPYSKLDVRPAPKKQVQAGVAPENIEWLKIRDEGRGYRIIPLDKQHRAIPTQQFKGTKIQQVLDKLYPYFDTAHDAGQSVFRNAKVSASTTRVQAGSWQEKAKAELEASLGGFESEYGRDEGRDYFTLETDGRTDNGESEWIVFKDSASAERYAVEYVQKMLDDDPSMFNHGWLKEHVYVSPTDIRLIASEEADNYLENIEDEDDRVLQEAGLSGQYEGLQGKVDKFEEQMLEEMDPKKTERMQKQIDKLQQGMDKLRDKATSKVHDDYEREITRQLKDDPMEWAEELGYDFGRNRPTWIQIDTNKAAKDAINTDGVAHFLDGYDGEEVELPSGAVAFGTN